MTEEIEQTVEIPLSRIQPNPFQPRKHFDPIKIRFLAKSIERQGLLQPIAVRRHPEKRGWFQIIAGECRVRATREIAGARTIKAYVKEMPDDEMLKTALLENMARQNMNPIEEARGVQELLDAGCAIQDAAQVVGRSPGELAEALHLLNLIPELQKEVAMGRIPLKLGISIGKLPKRRQMEAYKKTRTKILSKALDIVTVMLEDERQELVLFQLTAEDESIVRKAKFAWARFRTQASHLQTFLHGGASLKAMLHALKDDYTAESFFGDLHKSWKAFTKELSLFRTRAEARKEAEANAEATGTEDS